jgi:hypothetical protein
MDSSSFDLLRSAKSVEYYSPLNLVNAARTVMGSIDLDPASCEYANKGVGATVIYTKEDDGLYKPWSGNLWINPPYGKRDNKSSQALWIARLLSAYDSGEIDQAVLLVNATTDRKWFPQLCNFPICFVGRVPHYTESLEKTIPIHGSALVYFGPNIEYFGEVFQEFGPVMVPISTVRRP